MAHLAVLAFGEREANPTGGDVSPIANGRHALPKVFRWQCPLCLAGSGTVAFDDDTLGQFQQSLVGDLAIDLGEIGAWSCWDRWFRIR